MQPHSESTLSSAARENPCNLSLWQTVVAEVREQVEAEPLLASFLYSTILNHRDLAAAIGFHLANKLASDVTPALMLREIFDDTFARQPEIIDAARSDIIATYERDSACLDFSTPLLYFKGFHSLTAHRVAHWLWQDGHRNLALVLQNRISVTFGVDIHPAARIGRGILLDHATGVVIGETAVVEDGVSMMQSVTLGGTGKEIGDRHPKIRRGVLIGPGAKILGNIEVGAGAKIIAASVVLQPVPPGAIAAGVPARVVGQVTEEPARKMDHSLEGCSGL